MDREPVSPRDDALRIWRVGVDAVRSDELVKRAVRVDGDLLTVGGVEIDLARVHRIAVVGAGKAGAGMAAGFEAALGDTLLEAKRVEGWINVPADCVRELRRIHLHAARPAGRNEPTAAGVVGTTRIVKLVHALGPDDLCLCLLSGGGSALLPAPALGITLADKLAVTRHLSAAGADIESINTVRKQLSAIKGGGLARVCRAGRLVTLIISDILGDPLGLIASGPTVIDASTPAEALAVLEKFGAAGAVPDSVFDFLRVKPTAAAPPPKCSVDNIVIGNNAAAVRAAVAEAERLGYACESETASRSEGEVEPIGVALAERGLAMRRRGGRRCFIGGGEGVVRLVDENRRGIGGRNQQTALSALIRLEHENTDGLALLSAGTDGEDGPTDAAGALVDPAVIETARRRDLDPADFLRRNDAYPFFESAEGLIRTGPTHTNVCDVRVVVTDTAV
jgi:glycerate 2-kinase